MMRGACVVVGVMLLAVPAPALAQQDQQPPGVQLVEYDDGMSTIVYAYTRSRLQPILSMDVDGISFGRDPVLVFACLGGETAVVYRFDSELFVTEDSTLPVQYRLAGRDAMSPTPWHAVGDPVSAANINLGLAAIGAESNRLAQMMMETVMAARMPADRTVAFLAEAREAVEVKIRVTDPVDGEVLDDVFPLSGFAAAIESVQRACRNPRR